VAPALPLLSVTALLGLSAPQPAVMTLKSTLRPATG
jgi:hypothetical protein